jgi:metal-responsive CopG/Arc/MetJ family transcriptional regulator
MPKSPSIVKRKTGRPPEISAGAFVGMRLPGTLLKSIDKWAKQNQVSGRSDAMRRLLELGLVGAPSARQLSKGAKRRAAEMAGQEIDRLGNQTVTEEERARRKRRLIKGPREFRDVRADLPKSKS